ncbi:MAG: potassium transporter TrkG [Gammaproteobacteria bacterium]
MPGVAYVLGTLLTFFGAAYAIPILTSLITRDGKAVTFLIAAGVSSGTGFLISLATRKHSRELKPRDGFLLATLSWVLMSLSATIPLLLVIPGLSFTGAYFEAMSGLTTTGSTVLTGLDYLPPSINIWRHTLHWFGGLGIIVLAVAILPLLGVGGMQLYKAETPGPVKDEKLTPRITETAKSLWVVYTVMTIAGIVALRAAGMTWFDAICHGMSALSLGGFSTHDQSLGYYHSVAIEMVLCVLMVAASLNFSRHFLALRRLTLRPYRNDPEARAIGAVLGVSIVLITLLLYFHGNVSELPHRAPARHLQRDLDGDHHRIRHGELRNVAGNSAPIWTAVPDLHRVQHRLYRRRHQDVPHAGARSARPAES